MTDRQTVLAHYLGMEREAREDRAKELNATILDIALAANGLCESLAPSKGFYCCKCKETFEAEEALSEWSMEPHEFWGTSVQRETGISLCPFCGSDDLLDNAADVSDPLDDPDFDPRDEV